MTLEFTEPQVRVYPPSCLHDAATRSACAKGKIVDQIWDSARSPALRHHLTTLADWTWDTLRVLILYVAPTGIGLAEVLSYATQPGHRAGVYVLLLGLLVVGAMLVMAALGWHRRPHRPKSPTVRDVNRKAARILVPSALGLATLMAGIAVKPALLGIFGAWLLLVVLPITGAAWLTLRITRGKRGQVTA
jgi:hypothetical protein